jgi:glycosyltransferase involved in cell wall biosynthesis
LNVYGLAPINSACHWYRIREPLRGLAGIGHATEFGEVFDEPIVQRNDTIVTHILHGKLEVELWSYLWDAGQHTLVYDIDDDIWAWPEGTSQHAFWTAEKLAEVETCIKMSHLVTTPSPVIARRIQFDLQLHGNVAVLPNYVPSWVGRVPRTKPDVFTVGYQGAPQNVHQADLDTVQDELFHFLAVCKDARLRFYGQAAPLEGGGPFADRIDFVPWTPDVPSYYRSLHQITVGIGPLLRSPYTDAKSGIRAVEFASLGIPAILSDVPPYRDWVDHRVTGYMVTSASPHDWRKHLIKLYRSPELVEKLARQARARARDWTTEENAWRWERAYSRVRPDDARVSSAS